MRANRVRPGWRLIAAGFGTGVWIALGWAGILTSQVVAPERALGGAVRVYLHMRPLDLNPHTRGYAAEHLVTDYLFDHLLERDPEDLTRYRPSLAVRWKQSEDGKEIVFHLRDGVRWHDGKPLTAEDVKFTYDFCSQPEHDALVRPVLEDVASCEVIDRLTVRFRLKKPCWRLFHVLAEHAFAILPRHVLADADADQQAAFGRAPIGTGPFAFGRWDRDGNRITIVRNPAYWDSPPAVEEVVFKTFTDYPAALADFRGGGIDFFPRLRPDDFFRWVEPGGWSPRRVRACLDRGHGRFCLPEDVHARFQFGGFATTRVSFIAWNTRRAPLEDRIVRRAMGHLLDREALEQGPGRGLGHAVTGDQVWFGPAYDPAIVPLPFDPACARAMLQDEGWFDRDGDGWLDRAGRRLEIRIAYPAQADDAVLHQLARAAREIGVAVELQGLERGQFTRTKNTREFDGLYLAWVLDVEEDPYWAWHSRAMKDGSNYSGFSTADALIQKARTTADPPTRWKLLKRLQAIIHAEQPVLFVQASTMLVGWSHRLKGVRFHPLKPYGWNLAEWFIPEGLQ